MSKLIQDAILIHTQKHTKVNTSLKKESCMLSILHRLVLNSETRVEDQLMIYLQAHELFQKIYHKSMFFRQIGILFNTFCFYPDLQQLQSKTMFISSSKSHYKLRYKG